MRSLIILWFLSVCRLSSVVCRLSLILKNQRLIGAGQCWECWAVHSGYSYYRGGGGIPIGAYLQPNMDIKIFFIKIIKFDFSILLIIYILTQAWEITVKHCGSFGTCAQNPKSSFISTVYWTKKVILRPCSPKIFLYENH